MSAFKTLDDVDVRGKRVLVRVDLNVPMQDGKVTDLTRVTRLAPTLSELMGKGARVVAISHFERPGGKVVPSMSLKPIAAPLSQAVGKPVAFASDCVGPAAKDAVDKLRDGEIALLENLRFHPGEETNDPAFAKELATLGDIYVDDAFSAAHRAHASIEGVTHYLPSYAGRLMQAELEALAAALEKPVRPVMAVIGGAKISTKLQLLGNLAKRVDRLVIGGGMANTFLAAQGNAIGRSLSEPDMLKAARDILAEAERIGCCIMLPSDAVIARVLKAGVAHETVAVTAVPADTMILDVGPATVREIEKALEETKTVVWNGPLGAFEIVPFDAGTTAIARAVAAKTRAKALMSVAGGGDTVAALAHAGVADDFSYVSTAGGAFLEWLEGRELPGVAALARS
ncbi:MAG TPA: phosphoglycerate kinase [Alphaproteobacteria bacterium]|nr:phosphoglycerate kinase [Alphaproteobacteria bacterium]